MPVIVISDETYETAGLIGQFRKNNLTIDGLFPSFKTGEGRCYVDI